MRDGRRDPGALGGLTPAKEAVLEITLPRFAGELRLGPSQVRTGPVEQATHFCVIASTRHRLNYILDKKTCFFPPALHGRRWEPVHAPFGPLAERSGTHLGVSHPNSSVNSPDWAASPASQDEGRSEGCRSPKGVQELSP